MKVLLLGAGGMLGNELRLSAPPGIELTPFTRRDLDIRDPRAVDAAVAAREPDWVVNAAGLTNVDAAEGDRETAFAVNATAVAHIASVCRERGARVLHFSTDYVFGGEIDGYYGEDSKPGPVNVYGKSKLAGEQALKETGVRHLLIRTQWLFGAHGRSFASLMCERARARMETRVVADELGCCTYTVDLARATWDLIGKAEGTLHVANRGKLSRHALATRIFNHFGAGSLLTPCTTAEFGSRTRRPLNSALSVARAERLLGREMPGWEDALARYLVETAH